jgi:flagellar hook-length control protein FliK
MIKNLLSSFTGTLRAGSGKNAQLDTAGVSQGRGGKFKQLLTKIMGINKTSKPVAYVRAGKEVTFSKVPFYNTQGEKLSVSTVNKNGQTKNIVKRDGRISGVRKGISDPVTLRENMLSRNKGISQAIPKFHTRAQQHLKDTQVLRAGIVSGELETPGNQNGRLLKKLKEEERKEGIVPSEAWLAQVRQHMGKKAVSSGKDQLNAIAQTLKEHAARGRKGKQAEGTPKVELQDPTKPRVQKFQPQAIDPKTGKPIPQDTSKKSVGLTPGIQSKERSLKQGPQKSVSRVHYFDNAKAATPVQQETKVQPEKENAKVIGRITIEKREVPVEKTELSDIGKSHDLLKKLRTTPIKRGSYQKMTGDDSNLKMKATESKVAEKETSPESLKLDVQPALSKKASRSQVSRSQTANVNQEQVQAKSVTDEKPAQTPLKADNTVKTTSEQVLTPITHQEKPAKTKRGRRQGKRVATVQGTSSRKNISRRSTDSDSLNASRSMQPEGKDVKPLDEAAQALKNMVNGGNNDPQQNAHKANAPTPAAAQTNQPQTSGAELPKSIENLQEVLKKLETQAKILTGNGKTTIKVRLKPANLGSVMVHIRENGGKYDVAMRADSHETAKIIEHQVHQVKEQLSGQGIEIEKFVVDSGSEKNSSFQNQAENQLESKGKRGSGRQKFSEHMSNQAENEEPDSGSSRDKKLNVGTNTVDYVY